jgi:hypothetical protein
MHYRLARMVLLGLLIVLPLLVGATSPSALVLGVELLLLGGLLAADWNRRRLLAECLHRIDGARAQRNPGRPVAMRFAVGATRTGAAETL